MESTTIEINNNSFNSTNKDESTNTITKIDNLITYEEFFEKFLLTNKPCIFSSVLTEKWPCMKNWCLEGKPNFEFLRNLFSKDKVPIANCNKQYFNSQCKDEMLFQNYIDYWVDYRSSNYSNLKSLLYLKDWHCVKSHKTLPVYDVPKYFASDWLNEYYTAYPSLDDDYMFVYMGPSGTWTPLHVDVFTSYSWSANIVGRKRWVLFPPGEEINLKNDNGDLIYNETLDITDKDNNMLKKCVRSIEIIQDAGEVIFIPSGWHHQVWNLDDTISVNHNWINGCNVHHIWSALRREFEAVVKEINDCRDMDNWDAHCQVVLKASFGINYPQFYELLSFIATKRLNSVAKIVPLKSFDRWYLGTNHCYFDLHKIKQVLDTFIKYCTKKNISNCIWKGEEARDLLLKIETLFL